jgi:L-fuculose-phosphate aldolase
MLAAVRLASERAAIARHARRLRPDGLVVGTSGNLSARNGDLVAITPSGLDYDELTPELVCVVDLAGEVVEGDLEPSTELPMHLAAYEQTDAGAVVHTHSPYATVLACAADELPPIHYLLAELGGRVRVAPYATFGTEALARAIAGALEGRSAALLANHGTLAVGPTLERAYARSMTLEWLSALYVRARALGEPRLLDDAEIELVAERMAGYGQAAPR